MIESCMTLARTLFVSTALTACAPLAVGPLGIERQVTTDGMTPRIVFVDGIQVETNPTPLNVAGGGPLAIVGATYCEVAELVIAGQYGVPVACTAEGGEVSLFSALEGPERNIELVIRAMRRAGATVIMDTGTMVISTPVDPDQVQQPVTGVEEADGTLQVIDGDLPPDTLQQVRRTLVQLPAQTIVSIPGDGQAAQEAAAALGIDVVTFGGDGGFFAVGAPDDVRVLRGASVGLGRAAASIPVAGVPVEVLDLLRIGSAQLALDPDGGRLHVTGTPDEVRDILRLARALYPQGRDRAVRVAFVTGSAEELRAVAVQLGANVSAGGGVIRLGTGSAAFDLAVETIRTTSGLTAEDRPAVRVTDGRTATLSIGSSVPILVETSEEGGSEVEYRDVGTILNVATRPEWDGSVILDLAIEVSSVSGTGILDNPTFDQRAVNTTVTVRSGDVVIISGFSSVLSRQNRTARNIVPGREDRELRQEMHLVVTVY